MHCCFYQAKKALQNGEFLSNFDEGGGAGSAIRPHHEDIATRVMGRKTFTGGALNMGLVASNTDQLLTVITSKRDLDGLDLAKIVLISFSLIVQVSKLETVTKNHLLVKTLFVIMCA